LVVWFATPKDFKGPDDDLTDWIPHALIGILVEGVTYGFASVGARRKRFVPNDGNRKKRPQASFSEVGIGLPSKKPRRRTIGPVYGEQDFLWRLHLIRM
jgi:hypothetical protein